MDYQIVALVLFLIGVVLLLGEIVLPTGGIFVVGALLFFACGVGTILYYGTSAEAVVALGGLAVGLPASGFVAVMAWRRLSIGGALGAGSEATAFPQSTGLLALKGRIGKTLTPMRPSGAVEIDGKRLDAMSEGMLIDAGAWVRCVDVKAGSVVVRQLDTPSDVSDINLDDAPKEKNKLDDLDLGLE
jgi:membrane-bound serine protease (ClpP class)